MNRKLRKEMENLKEVEKKLSEQVGMFLSLPDKCTTCEKPFDKNSKEMRDTWKVQVYNAEKRIQLTCPECLKNCPDCQNKEEKNEQSPE